MPLSIPIILGLASACAPQVSPTTLAAIVQAESGGDPLAISVNGPDARRLHPRSRDEAILAATQLLARGANLDLGLGQINSRNLAPLGLSAAAAFDACRNLEGAANVLVRDYQQTASALGPGQIALKASLSLYNTGDRERGLRNGYTARVVAAARQIVPALQVSAVSADASPPPKRPVWDVFGDTAVGAGIFVFSPGSGKQP